MKGSGYIPRGLRLPFVLFVLCGMLIFMWGGDKSSFSDLIPPYGPLFRLSQGLAGFVGPSLTSIRPGKQIHVDNNKNNSSPVSARNEILKKNAGQSVQIGIIPNSTGEVKSSNSRSSDMPPEKPVHVDVDNIQPSFTASVDKSVDVGIQNYSGTHTPEASGVGNYPAREETTKMTEERGDAKVPLSTPNASSIFSVEGNRNFTEEVAKQTCNYAKGKWVANNSRPFYSGSRCKKWLSEMWACRLTNRVDFSFEKFRWQPQDCDMEEFEGAKFLKRMQDKTLAFIGDSLGRQQFQSLMCMITGGEERPDVMNVGWEYGLVKARGHVRPDGWAYRFPSTNTTILFYWSACLCNLEPFNIADPTTEYAMHLDQPPAFLRRYLPRLDVLVLNTGHHWNRGKLTANRWVMYVGGVRNTDPKIEDIVGAKNLTIHSIVNWVNSQFRKHPKMKAFYRSISPRHFFNGDWNTGGTCDNTNPLSKGKEVVHDESVDSVPASAVKGTKVKLLDITALSQLRDEGHISKYSIRATPGMQDCLHWCLPGIPDTWNEILFAEL